MENNDIIEKALHGRQVFLTGVTGMLGTSLILKMIRDTTVSAFHVLVRGGEDRFWCRMHELLPSKMVEDLRECNKIRVLEGDITFEDFGLDEKSLTYLRANVSIYIHAAASLNLKAGLPKMASIIIHPSLAAAKMALSFVHLERFVFVSTAYVNGFLHWQPLVDQPRQECIVEERIYPLHTNTSDYDASAELKNVTDFATTPEYSCLPHPFAYSYAKHLTERLLLEAFRSVDREQQLLLFRPSCFGPAELEPLPQFEVAGSAPLTTIICAVLAIPPGKARCKTNLVDPSKLTLDEVPVDVVVNRLVVHLALGTYGVVHAVSGASHRRNSMQLFEAMVRLRHRWWLPPSITWCDGDTKDENLCSAFKFCKIFGCSYLFREEKTEKAWQLMNPRLQQMWPLWTQRDPHDMSDVAIRGQTARKMLISWLEKRHGRLGRWLAMLTCPESQPSTWVTEEVTNAANSLQTVSLSSRVVGKSASAAITCLPATIS